MSSCICQQKKSGGGTITMSYPTLEDEGDPMKLFQENGYFVVRQLLTTNQVDNVKSEISSIVANWYTKWLKTGDDGKDWEQVANRRPAWKEGKWEPSSDGEIELGFRRLYRITPENQLFNRLSKHEKIVRMVSQIIGGNIKLLQSMALLKPPGDAEKKWHQDNGYFRLRPAKLLGVWIALDPANCANGCMHLLPQPYTEDGQFYRHAADLDNHIEYCMIDKPNPDYVVPIVLDPGDALVFHGHLAHYTPPNTSKSRRRSIQFHYASSECQPIVCPKEGGAPGAGEGVYFDCDPECQEQKYYYYKKAESLINGRDFGEGYI